jgi:hypothetical protein
MPIQSSGGFTPIAPPPTSLGTPTGLSAPVVLPTFTDEPVRIIGGEDVSVPAPRPVTAPTPIRAPPASIISEVTPSSRPPPPTISPTPIINPPRAPVSVPDSRFISQPPTPPQSVSSLLSEISRDTGINSQSVANFLFKKKNKPIPVPPIDRDRPPARVTGSQVSVSTGSSSDMSVPESIKTDTTKADYLFLDDRSIPAPESISSMSGFNPPSEKSSIKKKPIIAEPKEVVVLKKPELKRSNPFDIFSDNESIARAPAIQEDVASDVATQGTKPKPPAKKRPVVKSSESEREVNIIPQDAPAGRRMPTVKEKKSSYQSKADLQDIARNNKINILRPNGREKTMNELRLEIAGK